MRPGVHGLRRRVPQRGHGPKCIRTNADCADVCDATGRVLSRHTGYDAKLTRSVLEA
jgi:hypothetical protein